jgi:hypothetical protein
MTRRWWLAIVLALAACTSSPGAVSPGGSLHATPSMHSRPEPSDLARIYAAAVGGHVARLHRTTYLIGHFCTGMVDIASRGPCRAGPISAGMRHALVRLLGSRLRITERAPSTVPGRRGPVVIRLGSADVRGTTARVPIDTYCGPLCGEGMTLILKRTGGQWAVSGQTGFSWIS